MSAGARLPEIRVPRGEATCCGGRSGRGFVRTLVQRASWGKEKDESGNVKPERSSSSSVGVRSSRGKGASGAGRLPPLVISANFAEDHTLFLGFIRAFAHFFYLPSL